MNIKFRFSEVEHQRINDSLIIIDEEDGDFFRRHTGKYIKSLLKYKAPLFQKYPRISEIDYIMAG